MDRDLYGPFRHSDLTGRFAIEFPGAFGQQQALELIELGALSCGSVFRAEAMQGLVNQGHRPAFVIKRFWRQLRGRLLLINLLSRGFVQWDEIQACLLYTSDAADE